MDEQNLNQEPEEQPVSQTVQNEAEPVIEALEETSQVQEATPIKNEETPTQDSSWVESEKAPITFKWKKQIILMLLIGIIAIGIAIFFNIK